MMSDRLEGSQLAAELVKMVATAQLEQDLPDYLAERIIAIAEHLDTGAPANDDVLLLIEQLPFYDTFAQTGYLGIGITHLILEETIERAERQMTDSGQTP